MAVVPNVAPISGDALEKASRKARKSLSLPPILLEGDEPEEIFLHGPGQKYVVSAAQQEQRPVGEPAVAKTTDQLPESYDTGKLVLIARDPKCLHAQWDFSEARQRHYSALSATGHLSIRVYRQSVGGPVAAEAGVHPESRSWFLHIDQSGAAYAAQLGYQQPDGQWVSVATSEIAVTPPAARSEQRQDVFAHVPPNVPLDQILAPLPAVKQAAPAVTALLPQGAPAAVAAAVREEPRTRHWLPPEPPQLEAREEGTTSTAEFPISAPLEISATPTHRAPQGPAPVLEWTPEQEKTLSEFIQKSLVRHEWMGSAEIKEVIRGEGKQNVPVAQPEFALIAEEPELPEGLPSSPAPKGPPAQNGFWFNINAELVIYGSTEPNATVTIDGRPIRLRPDGTFSYRFALPDGAYQLGVQAVSADETDGRSAELDFSRQTSYSGTVGAHPQEDDRLRGLPPDNARLEVMAVRKDPS